MGALDPERYSEQLDELRHRFPGWQIWVSGPKWCARPMPLINAGSPEELAKRIRTAHSQPPDGSPSLASLRSYTARARRLRGYEIAAAAGWERRKAEQAGRMATAMADPVTSFYLRHGWRAVQEAQPPGRCVPAENDSEEPGSA
jgi:hypothetical protein